MLIGSTARLLFEEKLAELDKTYTLAYVQYDDNLSQEQVRWLVAGDWEHLEDSIFMWADQCRWESTNDIIKELLDPDELAVLEAHGWLDTLREHIQERDDSDLIRDLIEHTPNVTLRYALNVGTIAVETVEYRGDSGESIEDQITRCVHSMADAVGIDLDLELRESLEGVLTGDGRPDTHNAAALREMVVEGAYGELYIYWSADLDVLLPVLQGVQWRDEKWQITWTNPHLCIDDFNVTKVTTTFTTDFDINKLDLVDMDGYREHETSVEVSLIPQPKEEP